MASIILDDTSSRFKYGGGVWNAGLADRYFGGSTIYPGFAGNDSGDSGVYGTLSLNFQGTSIAFLGNSPPALNSQWALFSIDGGVPYNASYMDPSPQSTRQWYQSPTLPDEKHNITITHMARTSLDFVVITAGQNTPLSGETLIVDDTDPSITYTGSWTPNNSPFEAIGPPVGIPFGNSTHRTTSIGASAIFRFSGTSATVYGVFKHEVPSSLSVNYTMDGVASTQVYPTTASTGYSDGNYVMYSSDSLAAGNHTLEMQITQCVNQTFELDYIIYMPSFDTLATKPNINNLPSQSTLASSTLASSSTSFPSSSSTTDGLSPSTSKSTPVGAIAGGVLGGVTLILLFLFLLFWNRTYSRRRMPSQPKIIISNPETSFLAPFILPASRTSEPEVPQVFKHTGRGAPTPFLPPTLHRDPGVLLPSAFLPPPVSTVAPHSKSPPADQLQRRSLRNSSIGGSDGPFRNRMQRLQDLVAELNQAATGNDGAAADSSRIAELRGRIAELAQEDAAGSHASGSGGSRSAPDEVGSPPPPAYEG